MNQEPENDGYKWKCPKCENHNPMKAFKCGHCKKYERPRPTGQRSIDGLDHDPRLCSYVSYSKKQCPLAGVVTKQMGKGREMWCSGHLDNQTGTEAERIFNENVANYDQIMGEIKGSFHNDPIGWAQRNRPELLAPSAKREPPPAPTDSEIEARKRQAEQLVEKLHQESPGGFVPVGDLVAAEYSQYVQEEDRTE